MSKSGIKRDDGFRASWAVLHGWCQCCGVPQYRAAWPGLQTHHIIQGVGRSDEACNLLNLCSRCHDIFHGARVRVDGVLLPRITRGMLIRVKRLLFPDEHDAERLAVLYGRPLPDEEELPAVYRVEYCRWQPGQGKAVYGDVQGSHQVRVDGSLPSG